MEERRRSGDVQLEILTERVNNWMESTTEYRKSLCSKLDAIKKDMDKLPCSARIEHTKGIDNNIKALWVAVSAIFLAIMTEWIKLK